MLLANPTYRMCIVENCLRRCSINTAQFAEILVKLISEYSKQTIETKLENIVNLQLCQTDCTINRYDNTIRKKDKNGWVVLYGKNKYGLNTINDNENFDFEKVIFKIIIKCCRCNGGKGTYFGVTQSDIKITKCKWIPSDSKGNCVTLSPFQSNKNTHTHTKKK